MFITSTSVSPSLSTSPNAAPRLECGVVAPAPLSRDTSSNRPSPVFLNTFGKSLWSPGRGPTQMPDSELVRTGRIAFLEPGEQIPFTVAWRAEDGRPMVVDYGAGSLRVPG